MKTRSDLRRSKFVIRRIYTGIYLIDFQFNSYTFLLSVSSYDLSFSVMEFTEVGLDSYRTNFFRGFCNLESVKINTRQFVQRLN